MKKSFFISILFLLGFNLFSQNLEEEFIIEKPDYQVKTIYSKINIIDSRKNNENLGIIQKGAFNRKAILKDRIPLKTQIESIFNSLPKSERLSESELILNIRDFKFAEVTDAFNESGYCYLRFDLYVKKDSTYQKIDFLDIISDVKAMDVTKKNIRNGSKILLDFIMQNAAVEKVGEELSFENILNIDKYEKNQIPLYNSTNYKKGIYISYSSLKSLMPNIIEFNLSKNKKGKIINIETMVNGRKVTINPSEIYCVVDENIIYISTNYGYYPLELKDDDFYFEGKNKVTAKTGNVIVASAFFGVLGGLIASNSSAYFINKIDHLNGEIIPLQEIKK